MLSRSRNAMRIPDPGELVISLPEPVVKPVEFWLPLASYEYESSLEPDEAVS